MTYQYWGRLRGKCDSSGEQTAKRLLNTNFKNLFEWIKNFEERASDNYTREIRNVKGDAQCTTLATCNWIQSSSTRSPYYTYLVKIITANADHNKTVMLYFMFLCPIKYFVVEEIYNCVFCHPSALTMICSVTYGWMINQCSGIVVISEQHTTADV